MPFSVKSAKADSLLAELRELTGEGVTEAVIAALEERIAALRTGDSDPQAFLHSLWQRYPHLRAKPGDPPLSTSFNDWMYDEDGLPK